MAGTGQKYSLKDGVDVENWARLNRHIMDIWFAGGAYENWAKNQLEEFNSELNKEARKIMRELRRTYNIPVYFAPGIPRPFSGINDSPMSILITTEASVN